MKRKLLHIDHLIVTLTTFVVMILFGGALDLSFFSPIKLALAEFSLPDIYYKIKWTDGARTESNEVTIVDIKDVTNRAEIARTIATVGEMNPMAVGVDVIFEHEKDSLSDELLKEALEATQPTVMASIMLFDEKTGRFEGERESWFSDDLMLANGYTNLSLYSGAGCVRDFTVCEPLENDTLLSFPAMLAELALPEGKNLNYQPNERRIAFDPIAIKVVPYDSLEQNREYIEDRVILVGSTSDASDHFETPVREMSGIEVHGYSLLTLLSGQEPVVLSSVWLILLGLLLCYITEVLQFLFIDAFGKRKTPFAVFLSGSKLMLRLITLAWLGLIVWGTFILYVRWGLHINLVITLSAIVILGEVRNLCMATIKSLYIREQRHQLSRGLIAKDANLINDGGWFKGLYISVLNTSILRQL